VNERIGKIEADLSAQDAALPARREFLQLLSGRPELERAEVAPDLLDVNALNARAAKRREEFDSLKKQLAEIWSRLEELDNKAEVDLATLLPAVIDSMSDLSGRLLELSLIQAGARLESVSFDPVELSDQDALLIASAYRQDWQNARSQLVDTWRLIYFNANDLLSDLDIVFSGDIGNLGDNPFRIRDTTGRMSVGVQWDAPLTRLAERNIYRQALIEYQQARRDYYQFRDRVSQSLRLRLRQLRLDEINFELRRAAVLVAISQVDLTQLRLSEPPQVGATTQFTSTTARDLVQSLSDLLNVQNDFLSVWVNYEVQRLGLDHDLGIMELDAAGLRREHEAPFSAYVAGALAIRQKLCSASDLYPAVGDVYQAAPAQQQSGEELQLPAPLDYPSPPGLNADGSESLPAPLDAPPAASPPAASPPTSGGLRGAAPNPFRLPPAAPDADAPVSRPPVGATTVVPLFDPHAPPSLAGNASAPVARSPYNEGN
jgi:hypothetical protein